MVGGRMSFAGKTKDFVVLKEEGRRACQVEEYKITDLFTVTWIRSQTLSRSRG